jgi:hypothetical protein
LGNVATGMAGVLGYKLGIKRRVLAALDRSLERAVITDDGETRAAAGGGLWW